MISQLVSEMENEKDVYLEVEDFAQYLLSELDSPEFSEVTTSLKRELAVVKIESEKIQNDLIVYNNKKFDLLRDYLSAENDNTAQLRNIVDLLNSDVSDEPRQLISDMANASIRSTKLLQKYEDFQNSSIDATKNDF